MPFIFSRQSLRLSFTTTPEVGFYLPNYIMAFTSICVSFLMLGSKLGMLVAAQDQQVQFNQVINLNGDVSISTCY